MACRVVAIHAHPDDIEILAAGTLAILAAKGHSITIVTMTAGDCGTRQHSAEEIAAIRKHEARQAADVIGAQYLCAGFMDLSVFVDDRSRRTVTAILRKTRPDLVLTSAPVDYLCDHEATSLLVRDACFAAPAPNYATSDYGSAPPLERIPHLYYMDPIDGVDRDGHPVWPDFVVDVGAVFGTKRAMLACHASQREWLRVHHGMDDYLDSMERWSKECGRRVGVSHGEGFRRYRGHPYPQTPLLEELLGAELVKPFSGLGSAHLPSNL